ncbi:MULTISPECIES: PilZ domain-containing protein [Sphingobium]|uniref:PilZ domain-containing protein n=1 Tax=Sphingobium TaxID=165695 RepID=UPI0003D679A5|nr:PilZ domain-containing protein [Sphingobium sp. C100]ETI60007.1 pilus assembly protein PilZ [Sphingobium sp. C100]PHQ61351.1 MAG: PilZ domain-containing protein [Sphingobium sp.]
MDEDEGISDRGPARSSPRDSLFLLTSLRTPQGESMGRARIRNLSASGLMADCERPVPVGLRIELELRGIGKVSGVVAWSRESKIGLAFDEPIDPQLARRPVSSGATQQMPDFLRMHQPPGRRR